MSETTLANKQDAESRRFYVVVWGLDFRDARWYNSGHIEQKAFDTFNGAHAYAMTIASDPCNGNVNLKFTGEYVKVYSKLPYQIQSEWILMETIPFAVKPDYLDEKRTQEAIKALEEEVASNPLMNVTCGERTITLTWPTMLVYPVADTPIAAREGVYKTLEKESGCQRWKDEIMVVTRYNVYFYMVASKSVNGKYVGFLKFESKARRTC